MGESCSPTEITELKILFQEFHDIFTWSYKEILGLDPTIIEQHIDTWPDALPIRQKQCPIHIANAMAIKAKIDKLWKYEFIFHIDTLPGSPIPSLLPKNSELFMSAWIFVI